MGEDEIGRALRHQDLEVAPAKRTANPRTRKQPEPTSDATDLLVAPATKKQFGVHARNGAIGVLSTDTPDDSRPDRLGKEAEKGPTGALSNDAPDGIEQVLSKRERLSGVQSLVVRSGYTIDDARWFPIGICTIE